MLKTPSMRAAAGTLILLGIGGAIAHADPIAAVEFPTTCGTAFGCMRTPGPGGQATARVRWHVRPHVALVGIAETAERPVGAQLASQAIIGLGERRVIGRSWLELGVGLAASQVAVDSIDPSRLLDTSARAAVVAGAGMTVWRDVSLSLAAGSSSDGALYQLTASVETHWH